MKPFLSAFVRVGLCAFVLNALEPFSVQGSSSSVPGKPPEERIDRVIHNLRPRTALQNISVPPATLEERMAFYKTPAVSIAVVADYKLDWARAFGVKEWGKPERAGAETLFQAASISKLVSAVGVMRLAKSGALDLDRDINEYLKSSRVPPNGPWQPKVTLRNIMNHTAGLTVHGFPGYRRSDKIPTPAEILKGAEPANTAKVQVNVLPGLQSIYSGGGTVFLQQVIADELGRPFPDVLSENVFKPLGLTDSTFEQPLPRSRQKQAVTGHPWYYRPIEGKWHVYPEMAPAGLWTTPSDLARIGIDLQLALRDGSGVLLSSNAVAELMTTLPDGDAGLGMAVEGRPETRRFGHGGWNEGFVSEFKMYAKGGYGAVVMLNSNQGSPLLNEILNAIAEEYQWPGYRSKELPRQPLDHAISPDLLAKYAGTYQLRPGIEFRVTRRDTGLLLAMSGQPEFALIPESERLFFTEAVNATFSFEEETNGVSKLVVRQQGQEFSTKRID